MSQEAGQTLDMQRKTEEGPWPPETHNPVKRKERKTNQSQHGVGSHRGPSLVPEEHETCLAVGTQENVTQRDGEPRDLTQGWRGGW